MDEKRTHAKAALLAAEADYLTASGWSPIVDGKGQVRWENKKKHLYGQTTAVLWQREQDKEEERAAVHQPA